MINLKDSYKNQEAVVIFGGPSVLENNYDLSLISNNSIVFLESKALTPKFMEFGIEPDYYFAPFPEKTRTNSLQQVFMQAISGGYELNKCLNQEYIHEWNNFKNRFGEYADIWRIEYPHKKYRIKKNVILDYSPLSLMKKFPNMSMITNDENFEADNFSAVNIPNKIYKYSHTNDNANDMDAYFNPLVKDGSLNISRMGHVNSSAISLYPILNFMGFDKVVLIGMDMSILGSFEYSSLYTFKTMNHFAKFYNASRDTYSYSYPKGFSKGVRRFCSSLYQDLRPMNFQELFSLNKFRDLNHDLYGLQGKFMREKENMKNCNKLFNHAEIEYINIYEPFKYASAITDIKNISFQDFIDNNY